MKPNNKIYQPIFLFCLFALPLCMHASPGPQKKILIAGRSDSAVSVDIRFYPDYYLEEGRHKLYTASLINNQFSFSIPAEDHAAYLSIQFNFLNGVVRRFSYYMAEAGDSVFVNENRRALTFSGPSGFLFECQDKLNDIQPTKKYLIIPNIKDFYSLLEENERNHDSICNKKLIMLESYRKKIPASFYELLKVDIISDKIYKDYVNCRLYLSLMINDTAKQMQIINYYKVFFLNRPIFIPANNYALRYSKRYIDYLLIKTRIDAYMMNTDLKPVYDKRERPGPTDFRLLRHYQPEELREKLLATFFIRLQTLTDSLAIYIRDEIKQTKSKFLRDILTDVERKTKGSVAYDFTLPDSTGKMVSLHDFKGRAVVIDLWYTGCKWCVLLTKTIHPLLENKDTSMVFITVSTDKDRTQWKESLQKALYTTNNEINLYTEGLGNKHPFTQYYDMSAFPYLLFITPSGKISSINPDLTGTDTEVIQKMKAAITAALKED